MSDHPVNLSLEFILQSIHPCTVSRLCGVRLWREALLSPWVGYVFSICIQQCHLSSTNAVTSVLLCPRGLLGSSPHFSRFLDSLLLGVTSCANICGKKTMVDRICRAHLTIINEFLGVTPPMESDTRGPTLGPVTLQGLSGVRFKKPPNWL